MKSPEQKTEIRLFLERANKMSNAAEHDLAGNFFESSVNRSYYAIFYAATALLVAKGKSMSRHAGVISEFRQAFLVLNIVIFMVVFWIIAA